MLFVVWSNIAWGGWNTRVQSFICVAWGFLLLFSNVSVFLILVITYCSYHNTPVPIKMFCLGLFVVNRWCACIARVTVLFLCVSLAVVNPRRACAARVTVVIPVSVCVRLFSHYRQRGGLWAIPTALAVHGLEKQNGDFESDKLAPSRTALRRPTHQ